MQSVRVTGRDLTAALKTVLTVIEKRTTIPILGCVRIKEEGPRLTVEGTDLDMSIKTDCDVLSSSEDGFDAVVPAKMLAAAVKYAGAAPVDLVLEGKERKPVNLVLEGKERKRPKDRTRADEEEEVETVIDLTLSVIIADGDARFNIDLSSSPSDWPDVLDSFGGDAGQQVYETFSNGHFKKMLDTVALAISTEETRYYLNGVFWEPGEFVATDGHRLVRHSYKHTSDAGNVKAIIPRKAVNVMRGLAKGDVITKFYYKPPVNPASKEEPPPPYLIFMFGNYRLTTKTIDGTYPDYKRVIPDASRAGKVLTLDGERLRDAVNRVLQIHIASGSRGRAVSFKKDEDGKVILSSSALGEFTATAKTFAEWPEDFETKGLGFNGHYLLQFTQPGKMKIATEGDGCPALVSFEGEEDVTRVIMPMRV